MKGSPGAEQPVSGRPCRRSGHEGFTLLELMLSMMILGLIVVLIFGSFRMGVRAWEKGERDVERQQRIRIVLNLLRRQLSSAVVERVALGEEEEKVWFEGDERSLSCISAVPLVPGHRYGNVYVQYRCEAGDAPDAEQLQVYEKNTVLLSEDFDPKTVSREDFVMLIPDAREVRFSYLRPASEETPAEWTETWRSEDEEGAPTAIRVSLKQYEDQEPFCIIAGIESQAEEAAGRSSPIQRR